MKNKSKYLLNVDGVRYRANSFLRLMWNFFTKKRDKR